MELKKITAESNEWNDVAEYANNCSWRAGKELAEKMLNNSFTDG